MGNKIMIDNQSSTNDLDILDVVKVMLKKFKAEHNIQTEVLSANFTVYDNKKIFVKILYEEHKFKAFMIEIKDVTE